MAKTYYVEKIEDHYIFSTEEKEGAPRIEAEHAYLALCRAIELGMLPVSSRTFRCKDDVLT